MESKLTDTVYKLRLLDKDDVIVLEWEYNSKEQAISCYNKKKKDDYYKGLLWQLVECKTITTEIKLD